MSLIHVREQFHQFFTLYLVGFELVYLLTETKSILFSFINLLILKFFLSQST